MDERQFELAARLAEGDIQAAVDRQRNRDRGPAADYVDGRPCCADCGEPIPQRAALGYGRCIFCQERAEHRGRS